MKKIIIIVIAVIALLVLGFYTILPTLSITINTATQNSNHSGIYGYGELIQPNNRKGFIISHLNDGFSQTITCIGHVKVDSYSAADMSKYRYRVYARTDLGGWEDISNSKYLSNPVPGEKNSNINYEVNTDNRYFNMNAYSFEIVGNHYKALKVTFEGYIDHNLVNPLDDGHKWRILSSDEAYLFEGWGGLYYPTGSDGKPQSTFEIGETVKIGVQTHYGGDVAENGKPWKVLVRWPKDRGGEILEEQMFADNVDTYFSFTITEDMFSMSSDNSFEVEIYNTLVSKGQILVKSIDVKAKAPSDVSLSGPIKVKNGDNIKVDLSATVNSKTQLPIKSFQVSIYYGAMETLMPDDPFSKRWILPTTHLTPTKSGDTYKYALSFVADEPGYEGPITVSAWAYDTEGRSSLHEKKFGVYIYTNVAPPDETIEGLTGEDYGYGGHTEGWMPWDPSGGNWGDYEEPYWIGVMVAVLIVMMMALVGFLFFKDPKITAIMIIAGIVIAVLVYSFFFSSIFG